MAYLPGPYNTPHLYLQWGGKLPGNEQWSCGLRIAPTVTGAVTMGPTDLNTCVIQLSMTHANAATGISPLAKLSFVKLNIIGTDGHYAGSATNEQVVADVAGGGSASTIYPNQVAMAVSLTTGFSRGPAHRGRFYLPLPSIPVDANGSISAGAASGVAAQIDELIATLNGLQAGQKVSVMSRKLGSPAHRAVTGVEVGRVLDTQRRRRRSLIEDYQ